VFALCACCFASAFSYELKTVTLFSRTRL
jgi:hypothetical protein